MQLQPELPEGFTLRAMTRDDVPAVLALEQAMFPLDAWPEEFFHAELDHTGPATTAQPGGTRAYRVVEAAEHDGGNPQIVAYGGLMFVRPLADVQTIAVNSECEGRGLGTALLRWMIDEARTRGADDLLLEVRADNPRAQQLYAHHGFEHILTRPHYYPPGVDALIMRLRLQTTAKSASDSRLD